MNKIYNIVCNIDDNYVPLCGIMLTSLFENNPGCYFSVYILTQGLRENNRTLLHSVLHKNREECLGEVNICEVDDSVIKRIPVNIHSYFTITVFYRFLIADLLPRDVDRVLYLDCDILVRGDIAELYEMDLTGVAVAACPEHDGKIGEVQPDHVVGWCNRLGYDSDYGYFNAGVLLINLAYWREHNVGNLLIEYLKNNYEKCFLLDQDVLNAVLHKEKVDLPYKYNVLVHCLYEDMIKYDAPYLKENPVIVHYSVVCKPWDFYIADYPFRKEWEYYRCISPWRRWRGNAPLLLKLRRILGNIYYRLQGKTRFNYDPAWKKWAVR